MQEPDHIHTPCDSGGTSFGAALLDAVQKNRIEEVKTLLTQKNISLEERDEKGYTPLLVAADQGHTEIGILLIDAGANIDAQADSQMYYYDTPLQRAAAKGDYKLVGYLVEKGADARLVNGYGCTAADLASLGPMTDRVDFLKEAERKSQLRAEKQREEALQKHISEEAQQSVILQKPVPARRSLSFKNNGGG